MLLRPPEYVSFQWLADTMIDIPCSVPDAVKIKIIKQGEGPMIPSNALVKLHYAAYWEHDRRPFSSTIKLSKKAKFHQVVLGARLCLKGLELALKNIRGPTAYLLALLGPEVTWGIENLAPRIRPEPALFVIAVFAVKELHAHNMFYYLKKKEQRKFATVATTVQYLREKAKGFFQNQHYDRAAEAYDRAMDVIFHCRPETGQEQQGMKDLGVQVLVNSAVCFYKLKKPKRVLSICNMINISVNINTHCKALFYKGRAYELLLRDEDALEQYKKALILQPNNREISTVMNELNVRMNQSKVVESNMWQNVFNKLNEENGNEGEKKVKTKTGPIGEK